MTFFTEMDPETGLVDGAAIRDKGKDLNPDYVAADPFPHIVIDDFLPNSLAHACVEAISQGHTDTQRVYDRAQERLKREFRPDELPPRIRGLFYAFNSRPFLKVLENITGIKGLIPDPYFLGGGFHEISNGGHLSVHADFNHHPIMNVERRINLLIYLNQDWRDEYGGQLELWSNDMSRCVQSIVPVFNRAVMFNTTSSSNHGNPNTVAHPVGTTRKSIALYYYTATWDSTKRSHNTQFRSRPSSSDQVDWQTRVRELAMDLTPPFVRRNLAKLLQKRPGPV